MFPSNFDEIIEALTLYQQNLPTYKNNIGATGAEETDNNNDLANLLQAQENQLIATAGKEAATQIKNAILSGETDEPLSPYPLNTLDPLPFPGATCGAETRYNERRRRAKASAGYTKEIGIALGFEKPASAGVSPNDLIAAAKFAVSGNYQIQADYKKQGQSGTVFEYRAKGTEKWIELKTALQSPVTIDVPPPTEEGAALQIEVRCRLLKGNAQIGHWSPIYPLTVTA